MNYKVYQVHAFGDKLFSGNPAAVCPLDESIPELLMQQIATAQNLSETAFYSKNGDFFTLRWFTPEAEVDLCGHATLAAAHVLFNETKHPNSEIKFDTKSGILVAKKVGDGNYEISLPADQIHEVELPYNFIKALGVQPMQIFKGKTDLLLLFENEEVVKSLRPDFNMLKALPVRGLIATAKGDHVDFVSRFFAPAVGVNEDPATGSAHTTLAAYWKGQLNKSKFTAIQLSKRKGYFTCSIADAEVRLTGRAITFSEGTMRLG